MHLAQPYRGVFPISASIMFMGYLMYMIAFPAFISTSVLNIFFGAFSLRVAHFNYVWIKCIFKIGELEYVFIIGVQFAQSFLITLNNVVALIHFEWAPLNASDCFVEEVMMWWDI